MKNFGEKTVNLFDRKKKDAEQIAAEKAAEAQKYVEDQIQKGGEAAAQTKNEFGQLVTETGNIPPWSSGVNSDNSPLKISS